MSTCDLCALPLADAHAHLLERDTHAVLCACGACAMLFDALGPRQYRRIHTAARRLEGMHVSDASWQRLGIPVGLAFVTCTEQGAAIAGFPGPAGATWAPLDPAGWRALLAEQPALRHLAPDVEAWLVHRTAAARYYRASIDHCYRLAGLVRSRWQGVGGGPAVARTITEFFETLELQPV